MKTALITGSEGQLGKRFIESLKQQNYKIIGFDVNEESADKNIQYHQINITKNKEIKETLSNLATDSIDLLINNAGVSVFSPFEERTEEEIDFVFDVNVKGTLLMTQAVFNQYLKPQKAGCVINIGSIYGIVSGDMRLYKEGDRRTPEIYGATKAAVINLTKYFAAYFAPYNIRVNCISPGGIFNHQDPLFVEKYSEKVPFKRMGKEEELLSTLRYLISDDSSYVTGQNIIVDGGFTIW